MGREASLSTGQGQGQGQSRRGSCRSGPPFLQLVVPRGAPGVRCQMTPVCISLSTFLFCFSITASSSDTCARSWRPKGGSVPGLCLPVQGARGAISRDRAYLQQRALHGELAEHPRALLGAHGAQLVLLQREELRGRQHAQRRHGPAREGEGGAWLAYSGRPIAAPAASSSSANQATPG